MLASVRRRLGPIYKKGRKRLVDAFFAYGPDELAAALTDVGVERGDVLLMHSSFKHHNGFTGSPAAVLDTLRHVLGEGGDLLMVSMSYRGSTFDYLKAFQGFDVRKTPSMMGLLTEVFRRRAGVLRSAHPTHPVLAQGPRAADIIRGHETCLYPCGPGTPFEKVAALGGKVLFFDVPFHTFTFLHHLEHLLSGTVSFPIYAEETFDVEIVDATGGRLMVRTKAFSSEAITRRRVHVLESELTRRGLIRRGRVGNSRLALVRLPDVMQCVQEMARQRVFFYDMKGLPNGGIRA